LSTTTFLTRNGGRHVTRPEAAFILNDRETQVDFREALLVSFESCSPVRLFSSWRGKRNYSGSYWSSKNRGHVGFESLYERTALMVLDRERSIMAISSQPMWIFWPTGSAPKSHAPDFFVRHDNGDGEIIDVRPHERVDETASATFEATRLLCEQQGFRYRVMSDLDQVLDQNLRFLSRYRTQAWQPALRDVARVEKTLDRSMPIRRLLTLTTAKDQESTTLGWIYWLIWAGHLQPNLRAPLGLDTILQPYMATTR
jgi:hypothetical protein